MKNLNQIISWYFKRRYPEIEAWANHAQQTQEQIWQSLLQKAKETAWGRYYNYAAMKTIADYQKNVPIQTYDTLKPFIQLMMEGNKNVLWQSPVEWFAKSSGTTSDKSKFIPVSYEAMESCHFKGAKDIMAAYCFHSPNTQIYSGKGLVLGGSHQIHKLNSKAKYGDLSAVLMQNMPRLGRFLRTPDLSVSLMENWEEKLEKTAEITLQQNVTHLVGVPTWLLVLMRRVLEKSGKENLSEVWPNLGLYLHGGVSFTPYEEQFRQLVPSPKLQYWQTYNASEGFFGIQDLPYRNDMLLMLDYGVFYEFLPMSEIDKSQAKALTINEVELNTNYALLISTNAGLWRYMIGDTVKFTSLKPYRIVVSGRTKHFINAFGEEIIIDNADQAIAEAARQTKAKVKEYTAAPVYFSNTKNGTHEWLIEFEKYPEQMATFKDLLDKNLQKINSDYEAKRHKNLAMSMPLIQVVSPNTFYEWLKKKGKIGGQHKIPRLENNRRFVEEIKKVDADLKMKKKP